MPINVVIINPSGKREVYSSENDIFDLVLKEPSLVIGFDVDQNARFPLVGLTPIENLVMRGIVKLEDIQQDEFRKAGTTIQFTASQSVTMFPDGDNPASRDIEDIKFLYLLGFDNIAPVMEQYNRGTLPFANWKFGYFSNDVIVSNSPLGDNPFKVNAGVKVQFKTLVDIGSESEDDVFFIGYDIY